MILTPDNEQLLLYTHWFRLVRPEHLTKLGYSLEYLYTRMPELARAGYLHRVVWRRQRITDKYTAYELGVKGRDILRDSFGISKNATRFKQTPKEDNFSWIHHTLLTTDIAVALCSALGEDFTPVPVVSLTGDNIHADSRVRLKIRPDYSFTLFGKLHHIESDTGTEPIMRETLSYQQDLYRKCLTYLGAIQYKQQRFRVLFVTKSHERSNNMIETLYPALAGRGGDKYRNFILINYLEALQKDPLSWCNLAGEQATLLPKG